MRVMRNSYRRFQADPSSARHAVAVIVSVTASVVLVGALLMWVLDHDSYPSYPEAIWFTLQTVTTVGYGDTTPTSMIGRTVAAVVMLTGIALITVVTAAITSSFIEAARVRSAQFQAEAAAREPNPFDRLEASLEEISRRLERLESQPGPDDDDRPEQ